MDLVDDEEGNDLPVEALVMITTKVLGLFSLQLKNMYRTEEQKEIMEYINSSTGERWDIFSRIMENSGYLMAPELSSQESILNFSIQIELNTIMAKVDETREELENKTYKTSRDNVHLITMNILLTVR